MAVCLELLAEQAQLVLDEMFWPAERAERRKRDCSRRRTPCTERGRLRPGTLQRPGASSAQISSRISLNTRTGASPGC